MKILTNRNAKRIQELRSCIFLSNIVANKLPNIRSIGKKIRIDNCLHWNTKLVRSSTLDYFSIGPNCATAVYIISYIFENAKIIYFTRIVICKRRDNTALRVFVVCDTDFVV